MLILEGLTGVLVIGVQGVYYVHLATAVAGFLQQQLKQGLWFWVQYMSTTFVHECYLTGCCRRDVFL